MVAQADNQRKGKPPAADQQLKPRVNQQRMPNLIGQLPAPRVAGRQPQEKYRQRQAYRPGLGTQDEHQMTGPHGLIDQPGRARTEQRCRKANQCRQVRTRPEAGPAEYIG